MSIATQKIIARKSPSIAYICKGNIKEFEKELKKLK